MSFLDRKIDVKGGFSKTGKTLGELVSKTKQFIKSRKPRKDEPVNPVDYQPLTDGLYYKPSAYSTVACPNPYDYHGAYMSGLMSQQIKIPPAPVPQTPPTIPWFLSGVPEQYHKHYSEWMQQQPSGAPWNFKTYAFVTGQAGYFAASGECKPGFPANNQQRGI